MIERKTLRGAAVLTAVTAIVGCDTLTVPDLNNPGIDELAEDPSRSAVLTAAQGLLMGARRGIGAFNRYVATLGVLGREAYNFDPSDPRFVTELLQGPLDPAGSSFGGGGHWSDRYANIRNANVLLSAVEAAGEAFTSAEREAIVGFAQTLQAHDFLLAINTRHDFGAPVDVVGDPLDPPAPIVSREEVFNHIRALLDEANGHLANGGSEFPFALHSGFDGFDTPISFMEFNRALKARVDVYMGNHSEALGSLAASFLDDGPPVDLARLQIGVYHAYSASPGDVTNGLVSRRDVLPAHPSLATDAQEGDQRLSRKTAVLPEPIQDPGMLVQADRLFTVYAGLSSPIPFIRNEELILLRAEANLMLGDLDAALSDINLIRTVSGGLPEISSGVWAQMTAAEREDELLYNRRYSLLWEGGHRWIDLRRFDRLEELPLGHPSFVRFRQFPFPEAECVARTPRPSAGCNQIPGF